ncbi:MAG: phospho-N-acetylmuramoyl-pentapeptide-transferase, partial [Syntrophomonadaceae bacterium]|nr:phospho-N-acetylmuramoyl-pentapeptide-transferase [Syntrophomonadaceae bacterium]
MSPAGIVSIIAIVAALGVVLLMGPALIPWLRRIKAGQTIRDDGPQSHLSKAGTPTMGGIMMITAILVVVFLMAGWDLKAVAALLALTAFGAIGFWDDYIKVVLKRSLGLRARVKIVLQLLLGVVIIGILQYLGRGTEIIIPFCGAAIDLGWFYYPFVLFVLVGVPNAVNL